MEKNRFVCGLLLISCMFGWGVSFLIVPRTPSGKIADAEKVLRPGQIYECVTPPIRIDNNEGWAWYAIVEVENKYFGLKFGSQPSLKGVVAEQEGTIVFIQIAHSNGVTISNPLSAEN